MVRKIFIGLCLMTSLIFMIACNSGEAELPPLEFTEAQQEMVDIAYADFSFMIELLEDNFPFFGIAERREGQNLHQLFDTIWGEILYSIYNYNIISLDTLSYHMHNIIRQSIWNELHGIAHLTTIATDRSFFDMDAPDAEREAEGIRIFETNIIEEGKIAYISFWTFQSLYMGMIESETRSELFEFLRQVQDFEHLIIDVRGNTGGWPHLAIDAFIAPNLQESFESTYFGFFTNGILAYNTMAHYHFFSSSIHHDFDLSMFWPASSVFRYQTAQEAVESHNLYLMNHDDLANLDYAVVLHTNIQPNNTAYAFTGKKWLLIDEYNFSATENFVHLAKTTDTATLVGATTGGMVAGSGQLIANINLPNTGLMIRFDTVYITDAYGRALEEFRTTPHYFNREGMDALETVLAMINEMR